jgi:hypothetical protein
MESLQRETEELLDTPPPRSKTRRLARLRRAGQPGRDRVRSAPRQPLSAIAESLLNGLEQELTRRLRVLLQRIDVPSREELDRLDERVSALESRGVPARSRRGARSEPRNGRRMAKQ